MFELGHIFATPSVVDLMEENQKFNDFVMESLTKHHSGNWGDLEQEDKDENDRALANGRRILSAYKGKEKIWIITEADRSVTTILLPSEY